MFRVLPVLPEEWLNFAELVVPELQRTGVAQRGYRNGTLRDELGLVRPGNRFAGK